MNIETRLQVIAMILLYNNEEELWRDNILHASFAAHVHLNPVVENELIATIRDNFRKKVVFTGNAAELLLAASQKTGTQRRLALRQVADVCLLRAGNRRFVRKYFKRVCRNPDKYYSDMALACLYRLEQENEEIAEVFHRMYLQFEDMVAVLRVMEKRTVH